MRKSLFKCLVLAVVFTISGCSDMMDDVSFVINKITINSLGINLRENTIFVSLKDSTKENITLFKKRVSNSPIISFEKWRGNINAH